MKNFKSILFLIGLLVAILSFHVTSGSSEADTTVIDTSDVPLNAPDIEGLSQDDLSKLDGASQQYTFQSDVKRTLHILIHSLYKVKDIFLRELISNASDALDKIRFLSVKNPDILGDLIELNVTVRADPKKKTLTITDTGIGMSKEDMVKNLGTIAKSGTAEFLDAVANGTDNNLIGKFGVGFYSAFLVADKVTVISKRNGDKQHIWQSKAESDFTVVEDPRGDSLIRGTQIVLHLRDDAVKDYTSETKLKTIIQRYSQFINFPIYLQMNITETKEEPLPEEELKEALEKIEEQKKRKAEKEAELEEKKEAADGEADVEEVKEESSDKEEKEEEIKTTRNVTYHLMKYIQMNPDKPIWTRDTKDISQDEYNEFYKVFTKDTEAPMAHSHFKAEGDIEFRSIIYFPAKAVVNMLQNADHHIKAVRLFVRRVFITDELLDFLPRWLGFMRGIVDSDDLPLNVSRESLQQNKILKMIKRKLIKKAIDLISSIAEDENRYNTFLNEYSVNVKLGVVEDSRNRKKLVKLIRFPSSVVGEGNKTGLEAYVSRMKKNQKQIYFLSGPTIEEIKKSPFVERVIARGFEVLYMDEPIDEYVLNSIPEFDGKKLQNVAKVGLDLGDEDKAKQEEYEAKYQTLIFQLMAALAKYDIDKVEISNRLTTSPCAIVANQYGWSGNMERLMKAQAMSTGEDHMKIFQSLQKRTFEINPRHPLIETMAELLKQDKISKVTETAQMLYEITAIRSGFTIKDPDVFAASVEKVLRKDLDVDLEVQAPVDVPVAEDAEETEEETQEDGEETEEKAADSKTKDADDDDDLEHDEL